MGSLHHPQPGIPVEPAHRHLQEGAGRQVIAVEDGDQIPARLPERVVDVAGLGVLVGRPRHIADPRLFGEGAKRRSVPVIEQPDGQLVGGPVEGQGRVDCALDDGEILVVGGDHQIHAGPLCRVRRQGRRGAIQRPGRLPVAEQQHYPGIGLGGQQQEAAGEADGIEPVQGGGVAPPDVAAGDGEGEHHHHQHGVAARHGAQDEGHPHQHGDEHQLGLEGEWLSNAEQGEGAGHRAQQHEAHFVAAVAGQLAATGRRQPLLFLPDQEAAAGLGAPLPGTLPGGGPAQGNRPGAAHYDPETLQQDAQGIPDPGPGQVGIEPLCMAQHPLPAMALQGKQGPGQQPHQGQTGGSQPGASLAAQPLVMPGAPEARRRRQQPG